MQQWCPCSVSLKVSRGNASITCIPDFPLFMDWQSRFSSWAHLNPLLLLFNSILSIHLSEENPLNRTSIKTEKESPYFKIHKIIQILIEERIWVIGTEMNNIKWKSPIVLKKKDKIDFNMHMSFLTQNQTIASLSSLLYSHCCLFNNSFWYFVICQNVPLWSHRLLTTL